jgi:hypothetical protein
MWTSNPSCVFYQLEVAGQTGKGVRLLCSRFLGVMYSAEVGDTAFLCLRKW